MNFFEPDLDDINRKYQNSVKDATGNYVDKMTPLADAGKGADIQNQQQTTAVNFGGMDTLKDVSSFLDPSLNEQTKSATGAIENTFGTKGSLFSGAAGNAIAENARLMAERGWSDAYNKANQAKQQELQNQIGIDTFNNNAGQTNFQNQVGVNTTNFGNFNDIYGTELGTKVNTAKSKAELAASEKSGWDYLMDAGKAVTGGITAFGGLG